MANAAPAAAHDRCKATAMPGQRQLAALGTVLCLYRPRGGSVLSGWGRAVRVECRTGVYSDGLHESLAFFDAEDACCWRLYLLPDSDFLAWDEMIESLPCGSDPETIPGIGERLWRRLAGRLRGGQWQACAMKLHVLPDQAGMPLLATSLAALSTLGTVTAQRIAKSEGADEHMLPPDCCGAQSSFPALAEIRMHEKNSGPAAPLFQLRATHYTA